MRMGRIAARILCAVLLGCALLLLSHENEPAPILVTAIGVLHDTAMPSAGLDFVLAITCVFAEGWGMRAIYAERRFPPLRAVKRLGFVCWMVTWMWRAACLVVLTYVLA